MLEHVREMADLRDWEINPPEPVDERGENPTLGGILKYFDRVNILLTAAGVVAMIR